MLEVIGTWLMNLFVIWVLVVISLFVFLYLRNKRILSLSRWPAALSSLIFWNLVSFVIGFFASQAGWTVTFSLEKAFIWSVVYVCLGSYHL